MNVQFNDGGVYYNRLVQKGGMAGWLIKKGWAKSEKEAQLVLALGAIILLIVSFYLFSKTWQAPTPASLPAENPALQQ